MWSPQCLGSRGCTGSPGYALSKDNALEIAAPHDSHQEEETAKETS
jgi:hypothetical protein